MVKSKKSAYQQGFKRYNVCLRVNEVKNDYMSKQKGINKKRNRIKQIDM
jgi:hypothetical protein